MTSHREKLIKLGEKLASKYRLLIEDHRVAIPFEEGFRAAMELLLPVAENIENDIVYNLNRVSLKTAFLLDDLDKRLSEGEG